MPKYIIRRSVDGNDKFIYISSLAGATISISMDKGDAAIFDGDEKWIGGIVDAISLIQEKRYYSFLITDHANYYPQISRR